MSKSLVEILKDNNIEIKYYKTDLYVKYSKKVCKLIKQYEKNELGCGLFGTLFKHNNDYWVEFKGMYPFYGEKMR